MEKLIDSFKPEQLLNFFIDAFEGGSNYWYQIIEHSGEYELIGNDSTVYDVIQTIVANNNSEAWIKIGAPDYPSVKAELINLDKIENGLKTMSRDNPRHFIELVRDNGDAESADVFLQHVLFNKVVFG